VGRLRGWDKEKRQLRGLQWEERESNGGEAVNLHQRDWTLKLREHGESQPLQSVRKSLHSSYERREWQGEELMMRGRGENRMSEGRVWAPNLN